MRLSEVWACQIFQEDTQKVKNMAFKYTCNKLLLINTQQQLFSDLCSTSYKYTIVMIVFCSPYNQKIKYTVKFIFWACVDFTAIGPPEGSLRDRMLKVPDSRMEMPRNKLPQEDQQPNFVSTTVVCYTSPKVVLLNQLLCIRTRPYCSNRI